MKNGILKMDTIRSFQSVQHSKLLSVPDTENVNTTHFALIVLGAVSLIPIYLLLDKFMIENVGKPFDKSNFGTSVMKAAWAVAYLVNVLAVRVPGRFDGLPSPIPWKTVFAPSSWAFAVWGLIYGCELLITTFIAFFSPRFFDRPLMRAAPGWICANLFQSLWCAAFRPAYKKSLWLPSSLLGEEEIFKLNITLDRQLVNFHHQKTPYLKN
jgi:hypothetical protein